MDALIFNISIFLIVIVLLFFIGRSIMLWYWKIDTMLANQKKEIELLKKLVTLMGGGTGEKVVEYPGMPVDEIERKARLYDEKYGSGVK